MEPFRQYTKKCQKKYLSKLFLETNGNYELAAKIAGLSVMSLYRYYKRCKLDTGLRRKLLLQKKVEKLAKLSSKETAAFKGPTPILKQTLTPLQIERNQLEINNKYLNIQTDKIVTVHDIDFGLEQIVYKIGTKTKKAHIRQFLIEHEKLVDV